MRHLIKSALLGGVALAVVATATPAFAQETTSSIRGTVVSASGETLSGVSVTITHVPSGTTRTLNTNTNGVFFARGLKVGGPYIVKLSDGSQYTANDLSDINLSLGQSSAVTLTANSASDAIEEIVVTGSAITSAMKTGAASQWGRDTIENMNTSNRDIKKILALDPKIWIDPTNSDAISIAGTNNRMNSLTIDGVRMNDDFGLNNNGYPSQRSPISLDAVEQIAVNTAPFEVGYGNFQGGNINIVTKSGTNEFHGGGHFEYSDTGLIGSKSKEDEVPKGEFQEKSYSAYLGGPIIKDKLFFFASYEKYKGSRPFEFGAEGSGAPNEISGVAQADLDRVTSIASSVYNYDTMGFGGVNLDEDDEKILFKLDWNINDNHRASATYIKSNGNKINPQNTGTWGDAGMLGGWYNKAEKTTTYSFQAFSDWSENLSTEIKLGIKNQDTDQVSIGASDFALMEIATDGGGAIFIGPDFYRHANDLVNDAINFKAKADYLYGDHLLTVGYEMDKLDVFNLFAPGSLGSYFFTSIDDFEAQQADTLFYQNAYTNNSADAGASFGFKTHTLYIQDRWEPSDDLTIFAGIRYERMDANEAPRLNDNFVTRNGFANTENLDGKDIILPRIGFNYMASDRTIIRGGVGLFSGGSPNVWVSNSFSNDGTIVDSVFLGSWFADLSNIDGYNLPTAATSALSAGNGNVNATHPNFELPSIWKYNLAIEHSLDLSSMGMGDEWNLLAEIIYGKTNKSVIWTDSRRTVVGTAPDGRPIYDEPGRYDLLLDNAEEGKSVSLTLSVAKSWELDMGEVSMYVGYGYQNSTDINPGQSSTATSNYGKVSTSDRNNMVLATSDHQIKHRITANFNWKKDFWDDNTTALNLSFSSRAGRPFSYTFDDPGSRSTAVFGGHYDFYKRDTQLLYIPEANDPNVIFVSAEDEADFNNWVDANGLGDQRGTIVDRNANSSPWTTRLDLHLSQEVPVPLAKGHKMKLYLDIDNFTNMLNSNWGRLEQQGFPYNNPIVRTTINESDQYVYDFRGGRDNRFFSSASLWKVKFGITYKF